MKTATANILQNISQIRKDKGLSQENIAEELGVNASTFSKLERGLLNLSFETLADIADVFKMRTIDIITYPKKYADPESSGIGKTIDSDIKAVLQIELRADKKDQVLKLVFGENNLEIFNK